MTPAETLATIEAHLDRTEQQQRQQISVAWLTAALVRSRRLPSLGRLLSAGPGPRATPEELRRRREEHQEMTCKLDLSRLQGRDHVTTG